MKVLVTGARGQLGFDVLRVLKAHDVQHLGVDISELDITIESDVDNFIYSYKPDVIIHCAAYTAVDKAEDEKELCYKINVLGTKYLVASAKKSNAKFLYISTDYVFNGEGNVPFTIEDTPNPINYYGLTKFQGELEVVKALDKYYIVRISWVFGVNGNNFVKTMLRLSETRKSLTVVSDQIGSPTYTYDLSYAILKLIETDKYGIHHLTNDGFCSWSEFAEEIFSQSKADVCIEPILSSDYKTKAIRPLNSRLEKNDIRLRPWKEALSHFLKEIENDK